MKKKITTSVLLIGLLLTTQLHAQQSGDWKFERHNDKPFECTYHFINIGAGEFLMLDVIRGKKNTIRFFHANTAGLIESKLDSGNFYLAKNENRIIGSSTDLSFDVRFDVSQSGVPVPVINPFEMVDITALDHPMARYEGWVNYKGKIWNLNKATNFGTISQHYGRQLPIYFYYNVLAENAADKRLVGSFALVTTSVGLKIDSYYLLETTNGKSNLWTIYNSVQTIERLNDREWKIRIKTWGEDYNLILKASFDVNNDLPHSIVNKNGIDYFGSTVYSEKEKRLFPAVIEWRDYNQDRFINLSNLKLAEDGGGNYSDKELTQFGVYPNPASAQAVINLSLEKESAVVINVFNYQWQSIETMDLGRVAPGVLTKELNVSAYSKGIYFVAAVVNGERLELQKLQVVE